MTETVLLTGASGLLGRRITVALRAEGRRVRALVHRTQLDGTDEAATGSILDVRAMRSALRGCSAVVHLAAVTHARRASEYRVVNVRGTATVLDAARAEGVDRIVYVSSRTASRDGGWYSASKLEAEELVRASGLSWTIVRLPELYGGGGTEGVEAILDRSRRGRPIALVGAGNDEICPLHIDDAATACARALQSRTVGNTYTIAGDCLTTREFADLCIRLTGSRSRIVTVPMWAVRVLGELGRVLPLPIYPDQLARLRAKKPMPSVQAPYELGYTPRPLAAGLRESI